MLLETQPELERQQVVVDMRFQSPVTELLNPLQQEIDKLFPNETREKAAFDRQSKNRSTAEPEAAQPVSKKKKKNRNKRCHSARPETKSTPCQVKPPATKSPTIDELRQRARVSRDFQKKFGSRGVEAMNKTGMSMNQLLGESSTSDMSVDAKKAEARGKALLEQTIKGAKNAGARLGTGGMDIGAKIREVGATATDYIEGMLRSRTSKPKSDLETAMFSNPNMDVETKQKLDEVMGPSCTSVSCTPPPKVKRNSKRRQRREHLQVADSDEFPDRPFVPTNT